MRTGVRLGPLVGLVVGTVAACAVGAQAQMRLVDRQRLPQDAAVQSAYARVLAIEPMVQAWSPQWPYKTPKASVAATVGAALQTLDRAEATAPGNEELALLTGVVANFGYNLNLKGTFGAAGAAFQRAAALAPGDLRPDWLLGQFYCGTMDVQRGMALLLKVDARFPASQLPSGFWAGEMYCADMTAMPAHVLRAAAELRSRDALTPDLAVVAARAKGLFQTMDPSRAYAPGAVWRAQGRGAGSVYSSTACGFGFPGRAGWDWSFGALQHRTCMASAYTGPYPGRTGTVRPGIVVFARGAEPGQSLRAFAAKFAAAVHASAAPALGCPVARCLGFQSGLMPKVYPKEGGGYAYMTVFSAPPPKYPGLRFEAPQALPHASGGAGPVYYRPTKQYSRMAGTVNYVVMLDTAASALQPALKDYRWILRKLMVDAPGARR